VKMREEVIQWFEDQLFRTPKHRQLIEREAARLWHIRARQSRKYIAEARGRWRANRSANADEIRDELDGLQRELIDKAMQCEDWRAANQGVKNLADLHGAMSPVKSQVEHSIAVSSLPPEQEAERLEELRKLQDGKKG